MRAHKSVQNGRFQKLARVMSRHYGVQVRFAGHGAKTDGETIWLPANSDFLSDEGKLKVHALCDHERLHVTQEIISKDIQAGRRSPPVPAFASRATATRSTWESPMQIMKRLKDRSVRMMLNVYEDIRIELAVAAAEAGTADNLRRLNQQIIAAKKDEGNFWHDIGSGVICLARGLDISWLSMEHQAVVMLLADEVRDSRLTVTPADALVLAERTVTKLRALAEQSKQEQEKRKQEKQQREEQQREEQERDEDEEQDEDGGDEGEGEDSDEEQDGDEDEDEDASEASDGESDEGEDEDEGDEDEDSELEGEDGEDEEQDEDGGDVDEDGGAGEGDEDEGDEDEDGESDGDEDGEDEGEDEGEDDSEGDEDGEGDDVDGEDGEDDDASDVGDGDDNEGDEDDAALDEGEDEDDGDASDTDVSDDEGEGEDSDLPSPDAFKGADDQAETDDLVGDVRSDVEEESRHEAELNQRYIVDPSVCSRDEVRKATPVDGYQRVQAEVQEQVSVMSRKLRRLLQGRAQTFTSGDKERGSIDSASLATLRTGNKRVFSERNPAPKLNVAIEIMVDLSGSMGDCANKGNSAYYAQRAVIALAETLDKLRIPFEVLGYHTILGKVADGARECPITIDEFKTFSDKYRLVRDRMMSMRGNGCNVDGESIMKGAERLAKRNEERKIMIVVSDGLPREQRSANYGLLEQDLSDSVKAITKAGIEVYGVGAGTNQPARYYSPANGASFQPVMDVTQLASALFKLLSDRLLTGAAAA